MTIRVFHRRDKLNSPPKNRTITLARWLAPFGLVRLLLPRVDYDDLPTEQAVAMDTFGVTTKYFQVILDQYRALPQTYQQEREVTSLGSIPLIVVSDHARID
jgi:hypothetical protein